MFIEKIKIKNFFLSDSDIEWQLCQDVNFLVGDNGYGKTTLLNIIEELFKENDEDINQEKFNFIEELLVQLDNERYIFFDSEGRRLIGFSSLKNANLKKIDAFLGEKVLTSSLQTELQADYFKFKNSLANEVNEILSTISSPNITTNTINITIGELRDKIFGKFNLFKGFIDQLFSETGKVFSPDEFVFIKEGKTEPILPENLSSGEKQAFLLLLTCLLQHNKPAILLLDEPEISLHIEWQAIIIKMMRELNPNCQIIAVTHSPTMFMRGWQDRKKGMYDISVDEVNIDLNNETDEALSGLFQHITTKYDFNQILNGKIINVSLYGANKILEILRKKKLVADTYTYTTLIIKVSRLEGARELLTKMKAKKIKPNIVTYNAIIKKVSNVIEGMQVVKNELTAEEIQPDIITFSTLLGKARTTKEVEEVEELRKYFSISTNILYENKLKFKR